jgi:predicted nucleic acid-binding protein
MPETVFWDTAAFVALGNRDDALYQSAVAISQELAYAKALILTTDAVLTEVANTFSLTVAQSAGRCFKTARN